MGSKKKNKTKFYKGMILMGEEGKAFYGVKLIQGQCKYLRGNRSWGWEVNIWHDNGWLPISIWMPYCDLEHRYRPAKRLERLLLFGQQ